MAADPTGPAGPDATRATELDSAMATGNDEGEPGDPGPGPYPAPGERDPDAPVEESPEAVTAAHDDSALPPSVLRSAKTTTAAEDPLTPRFREPGA